MSLGCRPAETASDNQGESRLLDIIRTQPASAAARQAHEQLSRIYLRSGQYQRMIANLDAWSNAFPDGEDVRNEKADVEQFRGLPDQVNGPPGHAVLLHGDSSDFSAPLTINGLPATYLMDTGAWLSVMTEAEARRLGMTIRAESGRLGESSGRGVTIRTAVARDVTLGGVTFHDVSFAILPDVEPWRSMPAGRGGIIGIPLLLPQGCIRWTRGGSWELGCRADRTAEPANLSFNGNHLLVAAEVSGQRVFLTLDTGAETTDLNENFARQFAGLVQREGTRDTTSVSGLGGAAAISSVTLPELRVTIGGKVVVLRPAHVTRQANAALGGGCCVGNIGLDLLLQTGGLTIDFSTMTLHLR